MFVEHKEAGEVIEAPTKTMKVSEAIRIGAKLRPQCQGHVYLDGRTCALGAAIDGFGYDVATYPPSKRADIPELRAVWNSALTFEITDKNDHAGWTREQIADWLESRGY